MRETQRDKRPVISVASLPMEYLDLHVVSIDDVITNVTDQGSGRARDFAVYLVPCSSDKRK